MIRTTDDERIAARRYEALSLPIVKNDIESGAYTILVVEGGTYRQMHGIHTTYTVEEINDEGCRVVTDDSSQFTTPASELGLVEAVEGSVGGIEAFVPYDDATGEVKRRLKEEAFVLGVECRAEELDRAGTSIHAYGQKLYWDPEEAGPIEIADREGVPADWSDGEAINRIARVLVDQYPGAELHEEYRENKV